MVHVKAILLDVSTDYLTSYLYTSSHQFQNINGYSCTSKRGMLIISLPSTIGMMDTDVACIHSSMICWYIIPDLPYCQCEHYGCLTSF